MYCVFTKTKYITRGLLLSFVIFIALGTSMAHAASTPTTQPPSIPVNLSQGGKSHTVQLSSQWIKQKLAYQIRGKNTNTSTPFVMSPNALPATGHLSTTFADTVAEPPVNGTDVAGHAYSDQTFAYLCGPGAATISLDFWQQINTEARGTHTYTTRYSQTTWNDANLRAYMFYLAYQVQPPTFYTPGLYDYNAWGSYVADMVNTMNWEYANHSSNWNTTGAFYIGVQNPDAPTLHNDIAYDIAINRAAPVILVDAYYLPDWPWVHSNHYVAITGYDDNNGTYTYQETCEGACGTSGRGHYQISQSRLLLAMQSISGTLIW